MILAELRAELEQLASRGRKREWYPASRGDSASVEYRGKVLTDFASWDYLGVGSHKSIIKAVRQAVDTHGLGPAAPRLSSGPTPLPLLAERRLSEFFG